MRQVLNDLDRRQANMIRLGTVVAIDLTQAPPVVQVDVYEQVTDFLPWCALRAGKTKHWSPPDIGEQVLVLSPSGDMAQGLVLPGIFYDDFSANGNEQNIERTTYPDGSTVEYDSNATKLTVTVGTGNVIINCATAIVNGNVNVNQGTVTVSGGDVIADGVSLKNHTHGGVSSGSSHTAKPD